ncbi:ParB/RepB/Spo0J family partition protein [Paraburkholderia acidisoli]|uniref:ParB-like N-terminal domain-containing protein n=1 Tax=Paraburkholderia acidisoli TaxID=2571748 RepID=A0A7Z2GFY9_9BURK|nr:ParB N-terminal domain-containing protein [Paraburkholderia acidisoli]QGZ61082.1 hypothetical protein FAZ98_04670 [Paraburkholderia acidisoli]
MAKPNVKELEAGLTQHRSPKVMEELIASTVLGRFAEQLSAPNQLLPLNRIRDSPYLRHVIDETHVDALAESFATIGILDPIIVREVEGDYFELIAGHYRVRAAAKIGWESIVARVRTLDNREAARMVVTSNTQRRYITDFERFHLLPLALRENCAYRSKIELAHLLGCNHISAFYIDAYSELPSAAIKILEAKPDLIDAPTAIALKRFVRKHPDLVVQVIQLIADEALGQDAAEEWVKNALNSSV